MKTRTLLATAAVCALLTACTTVEGTSYTSENLDYSLVLPSDWVGVVTTEKETTWGFGTAQTEYFTTAEGADLFAVTVFTDEQWASLESEEGPKPTVVVEQDGRVWTVDQTQDPVPVEAWIAEMPDVLASFTVNQ